MERNDGTILPPASSGFTRDARRAKRAIARSAPQMLSIAVLSGFMKLADILLLLLSSAAAAMLVIANGPNLERSFSEILLAYLVGSMTAAVLLHRASAYSFPGFRIIRPQAIILSSALGVGGVVAGGSLAMLGGQTLSVIGSQVLAWLIASFVVLFSFRLILLQLIHRWTATGLLTMRVAIIGVNELSRSFIERSVADPNKGTRIVGIYDDHASDLPAMHAGIRVYGSVASLIERSRREAIDAIVIALPLSAGDRINAIRNAVSDVVSDVYLTAEVVGLHYSDSRFEQLSANPVIVVAERPLKDWRLVQKRVFDVLLSSILVVVLAPLMACIGLLIRLDSPGPVLFRQPRLGFNNVLFDTFKFRTMYHHLEDRLADCQTTRNDPRITRIGKFLRRTSLDELPQLLNVLRGNMSLVGPRPHAPNTKAGDKLFTEVATYAARHRVLPGITGWAQINGSRGETKTLEQLTQRIAHDIHYIENWSLLLDLRIMFMTVVREINSRGAF